MYKIVFAPQAKKDALRLERARLKPKAVELLRILKVNPYQNPPPFEKLKGFTDTYSRRINIQHRLLYRIFPNENNDSDKNSGAVYQGIIKVERMWTHYE